LERKFVFLAGPRQVGKTYFSNEILQKRKGKYYSWDATEDRTTILGKKFLGDEFVVLDELHKYARWKSWIKGVYDKHHDFLKVLVTGSARMDVYRKGGDSLLGRYFLYHLHPYSLGELTHPVESFQPETCLGDPSAFESSPQEFDLLWRWGGFPEPLFRASQEDHNRWSLQRRELLIKEDLRDLTQVHLISLVEHLYLLLPQKVSGILSINSLKENLQVAYNTVVSWLNILERLYIIFRIPPYSTNVTRSVHKENKAYLWDWSQVEDEGARFENLIAGHLLKATQLWTDLGKGHFQLYFLRDRDKREVDFCITLNRKPWLLVEAKISEINPTNSFHYFSNRLRCPALQVVKTPDICKKNNHIWIISADRWLKMLP
jgi:predicted AAA+ superfamily ATPase